MKDKTFIKILFTAMAVFIWVNAFSQEKTMLYADKTVRVKFANEPKVLNKIETQLAQQGATISLKSTGDSQFLTVKGLSQLNTLSEKYGVKEMKRVFRPAGKFEERHKEFGLHLWYEITYTGDADVEKVVKDFADVEYVQTSNPKYAAKMIGTLPDGCDDPYYSYQEWHYDLIDLESAWTVETGNSDVVVSVEDGGIDVDHPDLEGNLWVNSGETAGNNKDDDNNGYVDDVNGFNFVNNTGTIVAVDHGTHVAGTIAAETNNGTGMAGIAGGTGSDDGVRVMSCQVFTSSSSGGFAEAYVYAADMGAVISQNSWGYTSSGVYDQSILDGIDYFVANAGGSDAALDGGLVTFAAGNDGTSGQWYPGCYSSVVGVASTGDDDKLASYSNYGSWVDISAPGGDDDSYVYSTTVDGYGGMMGTSMACPHVSGVAALVVSNNYGTLTNTELWNVLVNNTDDISSSNSGYDGLMGTGRLNAYKALTGDSGDDGGNDDGNDDGDDSTSTEVTVTLTLVFDRYPEETSWVIADESGNTVASGGTYGSQADESTLSVDIDLEVACYDFTMKDSYGDGMCCRYGNGSYTLTYNGTTLASGGDFESSETTSFCLTSASEKALLSENAVSDIEENTLDKNVEVYPNPAMDVLNIAVSDFEATRYTILDVSGRTVKQGELDGSLTTVEISALSSGMYIVKVTNGADKYSIKLMKK